MCVSQYNCWSALSRAAPSDPIQDPSALHSIVLYLHLPFSFLATMLPCLAAGTWHLASGACLGQAPRLAPGCSLWLRMEHACVACHAASANQPLLPSLRAHRDNPALGAFAPAAHGVPYIFFARCAAPRVVHSALGHLGCWRDELGGEAQEVQARLHRRSVSRQDEHNFPIPVRHL